MLSHIFLGCVSCGVSSYTLLLYCPLSGSMYRARLSMTVAVRVRRPIPDTRWRSRVGRENRPEGGREGGRKGEEGREGGREDKNGGTCTCTRSGAYERQSREGACNSGSIQILISYVFCFSDVHYASCSLLPSILRMRAVQQHKKRMAALHHHPIRGWERTSDKEAVLTEERNGGSSVGVCCQSSLHVLKEGTPERLGIPASSNLPHFAANC